MRFDPARENQIENDLAEYEVARPMMQICGERQKSAAKELVGPRAHCSELLTNSRVGPKI